MATQEVKILGSMASPFTYRIIWALKLKGIEYEYIEEVLNNKSPLLVSCNPVYKKVPVFIHGRKPICESLIILEYIDEEWKHNPILPEDVYEKAMARFWAKYIEEKLTEVMRKALISEGEELENAANEIKEALSILDCELNDKRKFFRGETIGYLDIVLGFTVLWLEVVENVAGIQVFDAHRFPCFSKWIDKMRGLSIIKENLPPKNELLVHFQLVRQYILASRASE